MPEGDEAVSGQTIPCGNACLVATGPRRDVSRRVYARGMHVVERGSGVPLVLLHGFSVDHRLLLPLDPVIEAAGGWRRLYLDLPGHGRTPAGDVASAEDVVAAVEAEIRARIGDAPFAVLGSSFGGMLARRVAHDFRDQVLGLATIAGVFVANHAARALPGRTILSEDAVVLSEIGDVAAEYAAVAVVQTRENARAFLEHAHPGLAAADQDALARISEHYALAAEPEDVSPAPFTQPTLFLTGRQDQVVGYDDAWSRVEHYPRGSFAVLDAAGHNVHIDRWAAARALVADWLDRISAS